MAQGVLVAPEWAKRVDETVRRVEAAQHETPPRVAGLFYDLRPAVLKSAWAQNGAGLYVATAAFIVNNAVDNSFIFDVVAPTATDSPGGDVGTTRFFVAWRGRWEMVAGAGVSAEGIIDEITGADILDKLTITSASTVADISQTTATLAVPTAASITFTPAVSCALSSSDTQTAGAVEFVTDVKAVDGALGVETKYLTATLTASQQTATATLTTASHTVVSNVSKSTASRVASITAKAV